MKPCDQNYFFCNLIAIKRLMRIPDRLRRQGFGGALSIWAPVPVAGVATALVFRNEIADIVQDLVGNYRCIRLKKSLILLFTQILVLFGFHLYFLYHCVPF